MNVRHQLFVLLAITFLAGCGSRLAPMVAPDARIISVQVDAGEEGDGPFYQTELLIRSNTRDSMEIQRIELELVWDGQFRHTFEPDFAVRMAALGNEKIRLDHNIESELWQKFESLESGKRSRMPYAIIGRMYARDSSRPLRFEYDGWLSSTPGVPGRFR